MTLHEHCKYGVIFLWPMLRKLSMGVPKCSAVVEIQCSNSCGVSSVSSCTERVGLIVSLKFATETLGGSNLE